MVKSAMKNDQKTINPDCHCERPPKYAAGPTRCLAESEAISEIASTSFGARLAMTVSQDRYRNNRGFALVFSIFLVAILGAGMTSGMYGMMRFQREVQHAADEMRLNWAAEAIVERTIKLLSDYIGVTGEFPDHVTQTIEGEWVVVGSTRSPETVPGGADFSGFLQGWYLSQMKSNPAYSEALSRVSISRVEIVQTAQDTSDADRWRRYSIEVTAAQMAGETQTFQVGLVQNLEATRSQLFDFSVFYDDVLEISAGPDFELQGPIFSNKNIYLMNDEGSALTLRQAKNFGDQFNPAPFVINSRGNIYFYFQRLIGKNYLLTNSRYWGPAPPKYKHLDSSAPPSSLEEVNTPEIFPYSGISVFSGLSQYPPFFYYFGNGADLSSAFNNPAGTNHTIRVEGAASVLSPNRPKMFSYTVGAAVKASSYYTSPNDFGSGAAMSVSSAFDSSDLTSEIPAVNSAWRSFADDTCASSNGVERCLIKEQVPKRTFSLGLAEGENHLLIEPLANDTPEVAEQKFHKKAGIVIIGNAADNYQITVGGTNFSGSQDFLTRISNQFDFRKSAVQNVGMFQLNIGELMAHFGSGDDFDFPAGAAHIIYFHSVNGLGLKIVNGSRLPREGLTVASSGRVWIQGDYNTYEYDDSDHLCTEAEWDAEDCDVPPAAIFSDSFGVLSNEWPSHSSQSQLPDRRVMSPPMVNTALATGFKRTELRPSYVVNCPNNVCSWDLRRPSYVGGGTKSYRLTAYNGSVFECSSPDILTRPYQNGQSLVPKDCEYYEDGAGFYYVNPKSTMYQDALAKPGSTLPLCDPINNPAQCDQVRIPIFVDAADGTPAPPYAGVHFKALNRTRLRGLVPSAYEPVRCANPNAQMMECTASNYPSRLNVKEYSSSHCQEWVPVSTSSPIDDDPDLVSTGGTWSTFLKTCTIGNPTPITGVISSYYPPAVDYPSGQYQYTKLHTGAYSGGLENLINFQEAWDGIVFRFSGTLSAPWFAKSGLRDYNATPSYYSAPIRRFDYNEDFRIPQQQPPGTPELSSLKRLRWSRSH